MKKRISIALVLALLLLAILSTIVSTSIVNAIEPTDPYGNYSIYWGDPHWHSTVSDAFPGTDPTTGYEYARDTSSLNWTSLSDHYGYNCFFLMSYTDWVTIARPVTNSFNNPSAFVTLLAMEWTQLEGHHNIYYRNNTGAYICSPQTACYTWTEDTFLELCQCLSDSGYSPGTVLVTPHHIAADPSPSSIEWIGQINNDYRRNVEIYSKWGTGEYLGNPKTFYDPSANASNYALFALNYGHRFSFVGGSDSHYTLPGSWYDESDWTLNLYYAESGLTGVFVDEPFTRTSLFDAMYNRQTYATDGKRIELYFDINDNIMGSEFSTTEATKTITIRAETPDSSSISNIKIIKGIYNASTQMYDATSGGIHTQTIGSDTADFTYVDTDTNEEVFYYIRLTTVDGYHAWGSPIWISYSEPVSTPTPTPTPTPTVVPVDIDGSSMIWLALLPLGLLAIGFWQHAIWIHITAGIAWFALGVYIISDVEATTSTPVWIVGIMSIGIALAVFLAAFLSNRSKEAFDNEKN